MILRGVVLPAALLLALGACSGAFAPAPTERQTTTTSQPARTPPAIARAGPARRAPAPPLPQLSSLFGQETSRIDALIGAPDLIRSEGDGELRIYRNTACVLHVFAYPRGGVRQATHIEARTTDGQIAGEEADACLAEFMKS